MLAGDVTVGPHSRVLFGAVITAEGGSVEIGANCVIMENAVIRGVPNQDMHVGDNVLVGPHTHLTGCVIEGTPGSRPAPWCSTAPASKPARRWSSTRWSTSIPSSPGMAVPMGWFAGGEPAELVPPDDWDRIRAIMGPLDYPGTVFGVGAREAPMPDVARRYARGLALHHNDHIIPDYGKYPPARANLRR